VRLTFLALGECQLPLIPGLPCLRTTPLSFLLPMQQEGHYVAYIFPKCVVPSLSATRASTASLARSLAGSPNVVLRLQ
jgi:hypothetical protein